MTELKIPPRLMMPTARVVTEYERLIEGIKGLLEVRKVSEKVDGEIRVLQTQKEQMEARRGGRILRRRRGPVKTSKTKRTTKMMARKLRMRMRNQKSKMTMKMTTTTKTKMKRKKMRRKTIATTKQIKTTAITTLLKMMQRAKSMRTLWLLKCKIYRKTKKEKLRNKRMETERM